MSFCVIEGPNGSGKTSLIQSLKVKAARNYETLSSPNGTPLAQMLRPACRGEEPWQNIDPTIQFLLFSAARLDEYLRLVKNNKNVVIADRWWPSTYIYQCLLQGISVDFLEHTIHPEEKINLVIILDGEDDVLLERVAKERKVNPSHGQCSWTKEEKTMRSLINLYRNNLTKYLSEKNIPCETIDTTSLHQFEVLREADNLIMKYVSNLVEVIGG